MAHSEQRTTGSSLREGHPVSADYLRYSLANERSEMEREIARTSGGRTAKTLAKSDTLRVTLVEAQAGTTIEPSATAGAATLHMLKGRLRVERAQGGDEVGPGELLVFSHNLRDPLHAVEDCSFLVTVAWEEGAGAWDMEERTGRA